MVTWPELNVQHVLNLVANKQQGMFFNEFLKPMTVAIAMAALSLPAQAASLFTFTGTGTIIGSNNAAFNAGSAASLTFTFDADNADTNPLPNRGQYSYPFVGEIVGVFGAETFRVAGPGGRADVTDSVNNRDQFIGGTDISAVSDSGTYAGVQLQFDFRDLDLSAFSSDALPTSLNLADFTGQFDRADFTVTGGSVGQVVASFSSVTIAPVPAVPLPATGVMLLAGFGGFAAMRRLKRSQDSR